MSGVHLPTSSSTSPISTANSSTDAYGQLLKIYNIAKVNSDADTSNGRTLVQKELALLPEQVLNSIYKNYAIHDLNSPNNDAEWEGWGKIHVLDSLSILQDAIAAIACNTFKSLQTDQKTIVTKIKCIHSLSPPHLSRSKNSMEILLQSLDDYFTNDLTPKLQFSLDNWAGKDAPGEQRKKAEETIITFLNDKFQTCLHLSEFNLSTLPYIFDKKQFNHSTLPHIFDKINLPNRLETLTLQKNCLTRLPKEISILSALTDLDLSNNKLKKLPEAICKLRALRYLDLSNNKLKKLPKEIWKLSELTALDVSHNQLRALPATICKKLTKTIWNLSKLSCLDARDNQLTEPKTIHSILQTKVGCELHILDNPLLLHPVPERPSIQGSGLHVYLKNFEYVPSYPTI